MRLIIVVTAAVTLASCATPEQIAQRNKDKEEAYAMLERSQSEREYLCSTKDSCEKAFKLAKVYVQENSDMKIQIADDTIVSTYRPTRDYLVGAKATNTPGKGTSATIKITAECKDSQYGRADICPSKVAALYMGFKKYISSKMD